MSGGSKKVSPARLPSSARLIPLACSALMTRPKNWVCSTSAPSPSSKVIPTRISLPGRLAATSASHTGSPPAGMWLHPSAVLQDRDEGAAADLVDGQAGHLHRARLGDRAGLDRAQEVVEESLPGRGVVEDVAHERRLRGLVDEVPEPLPRGVDAHEKELEQRRVARHQLRRVQVPALVEAA